MCSSSQSQPSLLFHDDPGGAPTPIQDMHQSFSFFMFLRQVFLKCDTACTRSIYWRHVLHVQSTICHQENRVESIWCIPLVQSSTIFNDVPLLITLAVHQKQQLSSKMLADLMSRWKALGFELCMWERPDGLVIGLASGHVKELPCNSTKPPIVYAIRLIRNVL